MAIVWAVSRRAPAAPAATAKWACQPQQLPHQHWEIMYKIIDHNIHQIIRSAVQNIYAPFAVIGPVANITEFTGK